MPGCEMEEYEVDTASAIHEMRDDLTGVLIYGPEVIGVAPALV